MKSVMFSLFRRAKKVLTSTGVEKIPGVVLVYSILLRWLKPKGTVLVEVQGNKMYVDCKDTANATPLAMDSYEVYETRVFREEVRENMVVVDVGANIGYYSLIAAKLVGNNGKVYAFEPEPGNYETLVRHIQINGYSNIVPVQKAVSNKCGKGELFLSLANPGEPSFSRHNIEEIAGPLEVETVTLDEFFKESKVDFIKMDTQGAEGLVLQGAERILKENKVKILMEFWPDGLRNLDTKPAELLLKLQGMGFRIKIVGKQVRPVEPAELMSSMGGRTKRAYTNLLLEKEDDCQESRAPL